MTTIAELVRPTLIESSKVARCKVVRVENVETGFRHRASIEAFLKSRVKTRREFFDNYESRIKSASFLSNVNEGQNSQRDKELMRSDEEKTGDGESEEKFGCEEIEEESSVYRRNSIVEIINSIDTNITPSRTNLEILPPSDVSMKYTLDSANMSLIYSLTSVTDDEQSLGTEEANTDVFDSPWGEVHTSTKLETTPTDKSDTSDVLIINLDKTMDLLDEMMNSSRDSSSSSSSAQAESLSNEGSDILELPFSTVRELKENEGEFFRNDINDSVNEIIAELAVNEVYVNASDIVDDILESASKRLELNLSGKYTGNINSEEKNHEVLVINEIIHHIVDTSDHDEDEREEERHSSLSSPEIEETRCETVLEFCTMARGQPNSDILELNFDIERADSIKTSNGNYCSDNKENYGRPCHLSPIFEDPDEFWETSNNVNKQELNLLRYILQKDENDNSLRHKCTCGEEEEDLDVTYTIFDNENNDWYDNMQDSTFNDKSTSDSTDYDANHNHFYSDSLTDNNVSPSYSNETKEFICLEKHVASEANGNDVFIRENNLETSSWKTFPRYEDTSLYKIVSNMHLTDSTDKNGTPSG